MPHLVEHFERYLGTITEGWSKYADGHPQHAQVVKFEDAPGRCHRLLDRGVEPTCTGLATQGAGPDGIFDDGPPRPL